MPLHSPHRANSTSHSKSAQLRSRQLLTDMLIAKAEMRGTRPTSVSDEPRQLSPVHQNQPSFFSVSSNLQLCHIVLLPSSYVRTAGPRPDFLDLKLFHHPAEVERKMSKIVLCSGPSVHGRAWEALRRILGICHIVYMTETWEKNSLQLYSISGSMTAPMNQFLQDESSYPWVGSSGIWWWWVIELGYHDFSAIPVCSTEQPLMNHGSHKIQVFIRHPVYFHPSFTVNSTQFHSMLVPFSPNWSHLFGKCSKMVAILKDRRIPRQSDIFNKFAGNVGRCRHMCQLVPKWRWRVFPMEQPTPPPTLSQSQPQQRHILGASRAATTPLATTSSCRARPATPYNMSFGENPGFMDELVRVMRVYD
ncbi:hypothetical protein B0H14DRAFT_2567587 [Mycena olivaceomarginata]|nr:hypothetical protein B0H14DRAFT_2567587 [Mycena olivaceomarginata]